MRRGGVWMGGLLAACVLGTGTAQASVVLNEVNCEGTDWVELVNTGQPPAAPAPVDPPPGSGASLRIGSAVMATTEENKGSIAAFYAAFAAGDGDAMAAHYAPNSSFKDPAFGTLTGQEAGDMWRMLTARASDLKIELPEHDADGDGGTARWIAHYTFAQTGRPVVNDVQAHFRFAPDGRFAEHVDDFSFHKWSKQALGTPGTLLGWTPILPAMTQKKARAQLAAFRASRQS